LFYYSRRLSFLFSNIWRLFTLFAMFRLTFILLFITNKTGNYNDLFYALWIGLRFDMRLACFILIPIVIAFLIPIYNPLNQSFFRLLV